MFGPFMPGTCMGAGFSTWDFAGLVFNLIYYYS